MERLVVVMGVSGCGKSTVGEALAEALGGQYFDGDDFHTTQNVEKMRAGTPLTDQDRWPWLDRLGRMIADCDGRVFLACSALRRVYRDRLLEAAGEPVLFLHLAGDEALVTARQAAREGHYMPPSLVRSQFATLEPPEDDENALNISIDKPVNELLADVLQTIKNR